MEAYNLHILSKIESLFLNTHYSRTSLDVTGGFGDGVLRLEITLCLKPELTCYYSFKVLVGKTA